MPKNLKAETVLFRNIDFEFNKKLENSKTTRKIKVDFIFDQNGLLAIDEDNNKVQLKIENFEPANNKEKAIQNIKDSLSKTGESDFYPEKIEINLEKIPFIPISKTNELRRNILDLLMKERLKNYKRPSANKIKVVPYFEKEVDYKANIHNSFAQKFYEKRKTKVKEYSFEKTNQNNVELMRTKHCLKYAINKCQSKDKLFLEDEFGKKYPLKFDCKNCEMIILKS